MGEEAESIWLAFSQLSARRDSGEAGPKPISMEAIWCYVDLSLTNADEDEVEDLLYFLQVLDDKWLELQLARLEKSRKKGGKKGKGRSRG